jgi:hypothetical protein
VGFSTSPRTSNASEIDSVTFSFGTMTLNFSPSAKTVFSVPAKSTIFVPVGADPFIDTV